MLGGGGVTVDMRDAQIYIEKTLKNGKTRLNQRWGRGGLSIPTGGVFTTPPPVAVQRYQISLASMSLKLSASKTELIRLIVIQPFC